mgnify:CR=1 FL=1
MDDIYRENIMDHYKNPRNFGKLENANIEFHDYNPLCGDEITIQLKTNGSAIKEIKFVGRGCALSMATASMLTEELKEKTINDVDKLTNEDIFKMIGINVSPSRIKCVLLASTAIKKGVKLNGIKN